MPSKVKYQITRPFQNFNSYTTEVQKQVSNFILHFTIGVIIYPCWDQC